MGIFLQLGKEPSSWVRVTLTYLKCIHTEKPFQEVTVVWANTHDHLQVFEK